MAITTEQIHAVADQLQSQGVKPTQTAVREALGGGSFTTIAEALKSWRQEQDTTAQLAEVVLPNDLAERSHTLIAQVWEIAQSLANERLAKEREALEHREALMIADVEEAQQVVRTLESEQTELLAKLDELTATSVEKGKQIDELNKSNIQQGNELQKLNDRLLIERDKSAQLQDDLKKWLDKLEQQSQAIANLTATNAKHEAEKQAQASIIEQLKIELDKIRQDYKAEQVKSEDLLKDLSGISADLANLQGQNKTLNQQLTKAETLAATQSNKIEKLTADLATALAKTPAKPKTVRAKAKEE